MTERLLNLSPKSTTSPRYTETQSGLLAPHHVVLPDSNGNGHSYEGFTNRDFYVAIDKATIRLAPSAARVMDVAAGVGAMTNLYLKAEKLPSDGMIVAVDIDETAVEAMKTKFANEPRVAVEVGTAENLPAKDKTVDLVIIGNAIHLTDVPETLAEAYRVLAPGGSLVVSSAYTKDFAMPSFDCAGETIDSKRQWTKLAIEAIKDVKRQGQVPGHPINYLNYEVKDYVEMMQEVGFKTEKPLLPVAMMGKDDVIAICEYKDFAEGSLPGVPLDMAVSALRDSANKEFDRLKNDEKPAYFPRGWMLLKAVK